MNQSESLAEILASKFIDEYGIQGFIGNSIETFLTVNGYTLIYKYVSDSNFFGFSANGKGKIFIVLNTYHNMRLRYYTCAHEMWHVLKDKELFIEKDIDQERAADHFAASLMLPERAVLEMYNNLKKNKINQFLILFTIADASCMPYQAVERRFDELNLKRNEIASFLSSTKEKYASLEESISQSEFIESEFIKLRSEYNLPPSKEDSSDNLNSFPAYENIKDIGYV